MTIEESLKILDHYNHGFCEYSGGLSEPIKVAVDTMRKYQKIEQLLDDYIGEAWEILEMVRKVVEDGTCKKMPS